MLKPYIEIKVEIRCPFKILAEYRDGFLLKFQSGFRYFCGGFLPITEISKSKLKVKVIPVLIFSQDFIRAIDLNSNFNMNFIFFAI